MPDKVMTRAQLGRYQVFREGWEVIKQSLYDFQPYPAAGVPQLTFFALPIGQGGKTRSDTNMNLAGQLPANQEFLVTSVEVAFFPATPSQAAAMPAAFGAQAVATSVNDTYIVGRSGHLEMLVGSKPYLQDAPIGRFPPKTHLELDAAVSDVSTAGANMQNRIAFAYWAGRPYLLDPAPILLTQNSNFTVTLNWPEGAQAISNAARIGVILDGYLYRRSQ